ncbi:hypothetical protein B0H16DRAFT_1555955 [Mycena metata]|uniref:Uncharacterized protein n=1 Tax=Mycena metata TaxID=1033252 RepID=A0AAD7IR02_9AGAR|nr:hypothetical protein B0H16DRAFT_1555955 [Mycena metata]
MQVDPLRRHAPQLAHIDLTTPPHTHLHLHLPESNYESPLSAKKKPRQRIKHIRVRVAPNHQHTRVVQRVPRPALAIHPLPVLVPPPQPSRFPHRIRTRVKHIPAHLLSSRTCARGPPPAALRTHPYFHTVCSLSFVLNPTTPSCTKCSSPIYVRCKQVPRRT